MNDMQPAPVDLAQLNELLAGAVDVDEVLDELRAQSRADLAELNRALVKQDIPEAGRVAHRIKGASRMVGANALASISEAMEKEARQGRLKFEAELQAELARLLAWLDARLNAAGSTK